MYDVVLDPAAKRDIAGVPEPEASALMSDVVALEHWPHHGLDVSKLRGKLAGLWRVSTGHYRAIFEIDKKARVIRVIRIGHRHNVYQ